MIKTVFNLPMNEALERIHNARSMTRIQLDWMLVFVGLEQDGQPFLLADATFGRGPVHTLLVCNEPPANPGEEAYVAKTHPWAFIIDNEAGFLADDSKGIATVNSDIFRIHFGADHNDEAFMVISGLDYYSNIVLLLRVPQNQVDAWSERRATPLGAGTPFTDQEASRVLDVSVSLVGDGVFTSGDPVLDAYIGLGSTVASGGARA